MNPINNDYWVEKPVHGLVVQGRVRMLKDSNAGTGTSTASLRRIAAAAPDRCTHCRIAVVALEFCYSWLSCGCCPEVAVEFVPVGRASRSLGASYTSRRFLALGRDTLETRTSSFASS